MSTNLQVLEKFYQSFQKRDGEGMAACYDPQATFADPAFGKLQGAQVGNMWRMLCERGKDLQVTYSNLVANEQTGSGYWEAHYSFSATGRKVHNKVTSSFKFKDGKIIEHRDSFDMWKWAGMALGLKGLLLGWLPPVQKTITKNALKGLEEYTSRRKA